MITIIDYKTGGNIFSVKNSLEYLGIESQITSEVNEIQAAKKLLFPGVGSFAKAMEQIKELKLDQVIIEKAKSGTPFLGICVGMQVLFEKGLEDGENKGLGIIPGAVSSFDLNTDFKVPHMGWNKVDYHQGNPLFKDIENHSDFYFVHSYRVAKDETEKNIESKFSNAKIASCNYQKDFIASFWDGNNLFASQFHPEKSGENGLKVLQNFSNL